MDEIEVDFDAYEFYNCSRRFIELYKKIGGDIWMFHKNDADHFPSIPHGHNKENGDKLNVYSGEIYDVRIKKIVGKMNKKNVSKIQRHLLDKGYDLETIKEQN